MQLKRRFMVAVSFSQHSLDPVRCGHVQMGNQLQNERASVYVDN